MEPSPLYVAASIGARFTVAEVERFAAWAGAEAWTRHPLPRDRTGLVLTAAGPELRLPGLPPVRWHPGLTPWRLGRPASDPLVRALALQPDESVLDATLGLGLDALVLSAAGARVVGLEAAAPLALFTLLGLWRYSPRLARRIHGRCADHRAFLADAPSRSYDHVYLDPLFATERTGPNATWEPLRRLGTAGRPDPGLLACAWRVARRRVVLKLAPGEAAPDPPGLPPPERVGSRRLQFAVWAAG